MKKITGYIFIGLAIIVFSACQKQIEDPFLPGNNNNNGTDFKVRKYREALTSATTGNFSQTFNLTYDASNRLVNLADSADPTTKQVYAYNSGTSYTMDFFNVGVLVIHETFFLNSSSLIDSTSQYDDAGDTTLEKNIYNAANHITQLKEYDYSTAGGAQLYGTTDFTYDVDGNVTQETDNSSGVVYTYQYFSDLNTIDVGKPYETRNKNLTRRTTIVDGPSTVTVDHTYTHDSLNRVTSETQQFSTGDSLVKTYVY